jgi:hypothetical protein
VKTDKSEGDAAFLSAGLNARLLYGLTQKIDLRFDLGGGVTGWSGLEAGNPFTEGNLPSENGMVGMATARACLGVDYHLTPAFAVQVTPVAFSFLAKPDRGSKGFDQILTFDILFGMAYSL